MVLDRRHEAREGLRSRLDRALFGRVPRPLRYQRDPPGNGPPVGYPVQYRAIGPDLPTGAQAGRRGVATAMRANPHLVDVPPGTGTEPSKVVRVDQDQHKAPRLLGRPPGPGGLLDTSLLPSPPPVPGGQQEAIDAGAARRRPRARGAVAAARASIPARAGGSVPLEQVAYIEHDFEPGVIWRRNRILA